jgi:hypothetical protein
MSNRSLPAGINFSHASRSAAFPTMNLNLFAPSPKAATRKKTSAVPVEKMSANQLVQSPSPQVDEPNLNLDKD